MTKLNIESQITDKQVEGSSLITSNNFSTYNFVSASICIEIEVDSETYIATLQTGHSYYQGDYSLPSNSLSVYEGSELLEQLNCICESDLDDDNQVEYINDECETNYSKEQLISIYNELVEITSEAQQIVTDAKHEADELIEADNNVYVLVTDFTMINEEKTQCSEQYVKTFDKKESAQKFIDECNELTHAYIADKEIAISVKQSQY